MAILEIIKEGDPRLRQKAHRIKSPEPGLKRLAQDMHETMDAAPGVGLAGPQIGVLRRIIVVHLPEDYIEEGSPELRMTLLNPEIIKGHGEEIGLEGCLSIPGWVGEVPRMTQITIKGMDLDASQRPHQGRGLLRARAPARDRPPRRHPVCRPHGEGREAYAGSR